MIDISGIILFQHASNLIDYSFELLLIIIIIIPLWL